jgi:hypothetical protein
MEKVEVGKTYQHFKGDMYIVKGFANHTETMECLVLYQKQNGPDGDIWARPITMFTDHIERDDYKGPRFKLQEEIKNTLPATRFKIGQWICTGPDWWQIIFVDKEKMIIKVIETGPDKYGSIGSYLDIGREYTLNRHENCGGELWEIPSKQMKRKTSQVLLYWFDDQDEPLIDLDF